MSNWNSGLADRVLTSSWDDVGTVPAERSKVKVGYSCAPDCINSPTVNHVLGDIESISCIITWNGHKQLPDTRFQQQTLTGRLMITRELTILINIHSIATIGRYRFVGGVVTSYAMPHT